eukprot:m.96853 g.96853  ORF g.96853 m.96853 type:complete len:55 (+) comp13568_c0_seq2:1681-1845(+)
MLLLVVVFIALVLQDQLDVPDFVIEYDKKVNKDAYMKPSTEPKQSRSKDDANDL